MSRVTCIVSHARPGFLKARNAKTMSEVQESQLIRVSRPVKRRLEELQADRMAELGRSVSFSEVIEQLLADQWAPKPARGKR
jgi:hypothetical protein